MRVKVGCLCAPFFFSIKWGIKKPLRIKEERIKKILSHESRNAERRMSEIFIGIYRGILKNGEVFCPLDSIHKRRAVSKCRPSMGIEFHMDNFLGHFKSDRWGSSRCHHKKDHLSKPFRTLSLVIYGCIFHTSLILILFANIPQRLLRKIVCIKKTRGKKDFKNNARNVKTKTFLN